MIADVSAYQLIHEGMIALSQVEANGIAMDVPYLDRLLVSGEERIRSLKQQLLDDPLMKEWRKRFGAKTALGSRQQLGTVLFDILGYECHSRTATGKQQVDESSLERIDLPFVKQYLKLEKLKKLHSTYLKGIRREVVDGFIHPSFNLHTTASYRSSCQDPNFQNIPTRDPTIAKLIRRAFIPRPGNVLLEVDYAAIEVRIGVCYHLDPTMLEYVKTGYDMHRDMAIECFKLKPDQVSKPLRHTAKNGFVFPSFYGDYYLSITKGIWETINRVGTQTSDGVPIVEHLKSKGIKERGSCDPDSPPRAGTFESHIKQVEDRFWNERFPKYKRWREWIWESYQRQGWIKLKTGFVASGVMRRNEVINIQVQGTAFHCLLWSLTRMQEWLNRHKLKTLIVGQIHDSMILDVPIAELPDILAKAREIMCEKIRKEWEWIVTPLDIEAEGSDVNWYEKKAIKI